MQKEMMVFDAKGFAPVDDLGPRVYQSSTLTYRMFGWRGPLWMTQTCNDGSGCPFVQGAPGGSTYEQTNAWLFNSFGVPGQSYEEFVEMMTGKMGDRDSPEEIRRVFKLFDDDETGTLSCRAEP